jgi:hypothetical protein
VSSSIEVLEVFVAETDPVRCYTHTDPLRRHTRDSIWRQFITADVWLDKKRIEHNVRNQERYWEPAVRAAALARARSDEGRAANLENKRKQRADPEKRARENELRQARRAMVRMKEVTRVVPTVHHADNGKMKPLCGKIATKTDNVVEKAIMADCPACIEKAGLEPLVEAKHEPTVMDNADADVLLKVARQLVEHISKAPELVGSAAGDLAQTFVKLDELMCSAKRPKAWQ